MDDNENGELERALAGDPEAMAAIKAKISAGEYVFNKTSVQRIWDKYYDRFDK